MNPICKQNINSAECQQWISEVFAHCNRLLVDKQLEFWDDWWLHEPTVPAYQVPHLMSAYDCQKLRKQIERELTEAASLSPEIRLQLNDLNSTWRVVLFVFVVCLALCIIGSMVWLLNSMLQRAAHPRFKDYERQGRGRRKCRNASPRSFISFSKPCHPQAYLGPYRTNRIIVPGGACGAAKR